VPCNASRSAVVYCGEKHIKAKEIVHESGTASANQYPGLAVTVVRMKFSTIAAALLPLAATAAFTKEEYDSGEVMAKMMQAKEVRRLISPLTTFSD
jgi:hypothetical protein